jgi:hypothetical protein
VTGSGTQINVKQGIVKLVSIADHRPGFAGHFGNGIRIESADLSCHFGRQCAAHLHGPRPPFFKRRVIQVGVRIRIEDLVTERRWRRCIDGDATEYRPKRFYSRRCVSPSMSIASVRQSLNVS